MSHTPNPTHNRIKLEKKTRLLISYVIFAALTLTVITVSVAWMSISRTPLVSKLGLTVLAENRLEIAPDKDGSPGEWDVLLDLSTILQDLSPLKPVTYSSSRNQFFALTYGEDGRGDNIDKALTDEVNANVKTDGNVSGTADGYYIATTFWMRAPSTATIALSQAKAVEEGLSGTGTYVIGNPVWNGAALQHENGGNGLETAIRLGFRCQTTDLEGKPKGDSRFYIYEPNADTHANGESGYIATMSMDGGEGLVSDEWMIRQTTSKWDETTPVLSSDVLYEMGEFTTSTELFDITPSTMQKITLYVWLEGQDVDCVNSVSAEPTSILANVQFTTNKENTSTGIGRD